MFKVLIWDYTGDSPNWCKTYLDKDVEVVQTITPSDLVPEIFIQKDSYNYLLIFERGMRKAFDATVKTLKIASERVIYPFDANSWLQHPKATATLLNETNGIRARKRVIFNELKKFNTFTTCTVENMEYIGTADDPLRMPNMFIFNFNWASNDMKRFRELSKQYFNVDDSAGYFLDLGANIGTSGLYFCKKLEPNLKLLAFEPDPENYKLHRINMILNDMEDVTDLVNCGLSNEESELMFYSNGNNPGARGFIQHGHSTPIATVKVIQLDSYLAENNIPAQDVKYIWLDTEGFEDKVLLGAENLLRENPVPIFMECNLKAWDASGCFEDMLALLAENYSHFILFNLTDRKETLHSLEELRKFERPNGPLGQVGDIFLIRKGAI